MNKLIGYLRLTRPANLVTAMADILAGVALAGFVFENQSSYITVGILLIATVGLYGGGVVFNDVFDAELDQVERPERPIPSGLISKSAATRWALMLLIVGVLSALLVNTYPSGILALAIAVAAVVYDKWGKHHSLFGPVNMGLCRGLNLLLGISIVPTALFAIGYVAIFPILYIAAITMISRGEVHGGKKTTLVAGSIYYMLVIGSILLVAFLKGQVLVSGIFLSLFALMIFPPLIKAIRQPSGKAIGKAVKTGVIGLILMNAAWAAAAGSIPLAIVIAILLPLSLLLARIFAVT